MKNRIYGDEVKIDSKEVRDFFDLRAVKNGSSITSVNLQKDHVLAEARDLNEKSLIVPLLDLNGKEKVLEIGCGVGRFVPAIADKINSYLGIDFSSELIKIATENFYEFKNAKFQVMLATDIKSDELLDKPPFNLIMIMGLMVYLNDDDCNNAIDEILTLIDQKSGVIYLRESISIIDKRLTLREFYSDELEANYNAIYRTEAEYLKLIDKLLKNGFKIFRSDILLKDGLTNRSETSQRYWILKNY